MKKENGEYIILGMYPDMWGAIEEEIKKGWFVPSKSEWAAFGNKFNIEQLDYYNSKYNLRAWYWTSTQLNIDGVYLTIFSDECIDLGAVGAEGFIRLSTTF